MIEEKSFVDALRSYFESRKRLQDLCVAAGVTEEIDDIHDERYDEFGDDVREEYNTYRISIEDLTHALRPDVIFGGSTESFKKIALLFHKYPKIVVSLNNFIISEAETAKEGNYLNIWGALVKLISLYNFNPDKWFERLNMQDMAPLFVKVGIPNWMHKRYIEAIYAYVYGFFSSSSALCRSIVESILKDKVLPRTGSERKYNLNELLEFATKYKLLTPYAVTLAHGVRIKGKIVMHDVKKEISENEAYRVIKYT